MAQNKADTNKSDEASPFALLMKSTASKETKTPHKDAHNDKHIDDSRAMKTDNRAEAATQAQAKSVTKTDKADKGDDKPIGAKEGAAKEEKTVNTDTAADNQTQIAEPQPVNPQIQQAAQPAITAANDDTGAADDITAAPAAAAAQDTKAAQNNAAPEAGDETQDVQAGKPAGPQTAANPATAKTSDGKADGVKTAKNNNATANDIKADAANAAQNDKAAADAAAPKPSAPQRVNAQADNAITAPQTLQPLQSAQAPVPAQHLHVTAQPTPNVPALAVEIAAKSQSGAKQFDIRLDPPELGRVEVRLSIDATGKASAHLSADQPQTLDLLQKDAPALTRALREAGLDVSQDGLNFSLRHQASQDGGANHGGSRGSSRSFTLAASTSIEATATSTAYRGLSDGRLDIKV